MGSGAIFAGSRLAVRQSLPKTLPPINISAGPASKIPTPNAVRPSHFFDRHFMHEP